MLDFIKSVYRVFVLIGFWVFLIICAIGGGVLSNLTYSPASSSWYGNSSSSGVHPFWGVIIGLIVGFVFDVLIFGYIATILNIDENLELLRVNGINSGRSSVLNLGNATPVVRLQDAKKCSKCKKSVDSGYTACPYCGGSKFE